LFNRDKRNFVNAGRFHGMQCKIYSAIGATDYIYTADARGTLNTRARFFSSAFWRSARQSENDAKAITLWVESAKPISNL